MKRASVLTRIFLASFIVIGVAAGLWFGNSQAAAEPVSYTHLDVYKRQTSP